MSEWKYKNNPTRWIFTNGKYRAVVLMIKKDRWHGSVEYSTKNYSSPIFDTAADTRTWCLEKITELNADG